MMEDPPKPKRQLFNRPAWAQAPSAPLLDTPTGDANLRTSTDSRSPDDTVFTRSATSYAEIVAERERKKRAKAAKKAEKEARRNSDLQRKGSASASKGRRDGDLDEAGGSAITDSVKRRRITDEDYKAFGLESPSATRKEKEKEEVEGYEVVESPVKRPVRAATRETVPVRKPGVSRTNVIELGDSEDDEIQVTSETTNRPHVLSQAVTEEDASDEEFPELAAAARERRRLRDLEQARATPPVTMSNNPSFSREDSIPTPPAAPDPVIQLLVTSPIPNTKPLVVHRKLSQRLQEIRQVWCQRQQFTPEFASSVFLIYKMRRLYDVTTCKSLGIEVDSEGRILGPAGRKDGFFDSEEDRAKVHVQAVTDELFEELKKEKQRELDKKTQVPDLVEDVEDGTPVAEGKAEPEQSLLRILLKAKGYKDFRLKVKPVSRWSCIVTCEP